MPNQNIDLRHLRYFVAVAEHESISRAAQATASDGAYLLPVIRPER
jgi:Bacterial regulatory helix-turn-helix protein, lysR family